jgi:hypothetical protein
MKTDDFLRRYQKLQLSIVYDELIDLGYALIGYSASDPITFWNNAFVTNPLNDRQIATVEATFDTIDRTPSFYFDKSQQSIADNLTRHGYKKNYEDNWLFWPHKQVMVDADLVRKVESEDDLTLFIQTFDQCYQDNDPQNPYGNQRLFAIHKKCLA